MKPTNPPALATKLLESLVPQRTSEALLGDLIEQYEAGRSRTWYWQQVILALVISAGREVTDAQAPGGSRRHRRLRYRSVALLFLDVAGRHDSWERTWGLGGVPTVSCRLLSSAPLPAAGSCVDHIPGRWCSSVQVSASSRVSWPLRCMPCLPFSIGCPLPSSLFCGCRLHHLAARRVGGRALGFVRCKRCLGVPGLGAPTYGPR